MRHNPELGVLLILAGFVLAIFGAGVIVGTILS